MSSFTTKNSTITTNSTIGIKRPADTDTPPPVKNPRTGEVDQDLIIGPSTAPVLTRNQLRELLDKMPSCDKADVDEVLQDLNDNFQKLELELKYNDKVPMVYTKSLLDSLDAELAKLSLKGGKKMKGGMIAGINAPTLLLYLIADAMKQSIEKTRDLAVDVLQKGVQLLELFSNKQGCGEQFLYQLLGKKLMDFFKFYLLGLMSMEAVKSNPLILLNQLTALLPLVAEYATKGVGMTIVSIIGFLIYHFVDHYKDKLTKGGKDKLKIFDEALTAIHEATSEEVVGTVESKVGKLKTAAEKLHKELTSSMTEEGRNEFMEEIGNNLTEKQRFLDNANDYVGNINETMNMEELHKKIKKPKTTSTIVDAPPLFEEGGPGNNGGKKKKHRSTQKKKKGTKNHKNKKAKRKTNKKSRKG